MKRKRTDLANLNLLDLTPVPVAEWTEQGELVVVTRPAPPKPWKAPFEWLSATVAAKRLRLDGVGSAAWRAMDGRKTVADVAAELDQTFGDEVEPSAERLGMLLRTMHREGLIGYVGIDAQADSPRLSAAGERSNQGITANG